jgi:hypothetical protein
VPAVRPDLGEQAPSIEQRLEFWQRLHERLARLGKRIDPAKLPSLLAAVQGERGGVFRSAILDLF